MINQRILGQLDKKELKAVPIHELIPYDKNPRKNADAVDKVASSLKEFGLVKNSVICDENMVLIDKSTKQIAGYVYKKTFCYARWCIAWETYELTWQANQ